MLAITYTLKHKLSNRIVGYFSLANDKITLNDFSSPTDFNRFRRKRFINRKRIKSYPAVKLCRLAVDKSL